MGTMLKYGSEGAKSFYDKYVIPPHIARAHADGDIHIHDKDFYTLTETCCQIDLLKLFHGGFSTGHGYLREPKDIRSYAALACIAIQANQNEMHGGQSVPNFDYSMAEGVDKTYRKEYFKALIEFLQIRKGMSYEDAEALISAAKEELGTTSPWAAPVHTANALPNICPGISGRTVLRRSLRKRQWMPAPMRKKTAWRERRTRLPTRRWRPWCTT